MISKLNSNDGIPPKKDFKQNKTNKNVKNVFQQLLAFLCIHYEITKNLIFINVF